MVFRLDGNDAKVIHVPLVATLKTFGACFASWGLPLFAFLMFVVVRALRGRDLDRRQMLWRAWPVLIPIVWFEVLSNHTQIHTFFVLRSGAAAIGVAVAAALIAANVTREDLVLQARHTFTRRRPLLPST
jgi:hypothetical protein